MHVGMHILTLKIWKLISVFLLVYPLFLECWISSTMVPFRSVILISPSQEGGGEFGTKWNKYLTKKIMKMKNNRKTPHF